MTTDFAAILERPQSETDLRSTDLPVSEKDYIELPPASGTAIQGNALLSDLVRIPKTTLLAFFRQRALQPLLEAIDKSRDILTWEDDWDGEGSKAYSAATWERATTFLTTNYRLLADARLELPDPPHIRPGPDGSFDIRWKQADIGLSVNIPEDEAEPATFYGHHVSGSKISGTMMLSEDNQWLLLWLTSK